MRGDRRLLQCCNGHLSICPIHTSHLLCRSRPVVRAHHTPPPCFAREPAKLKYHHVFDCDCDFDGALYTESSQRKCTESVRGSYAVRPRESFLAERTHVQKSHVNTSTDVHATPPVETRTGLGGRGGPCGHCMLADDPRRCRLPEQRTVSHCICQ